MSRHDTASGPPEDLFGPVADGVDWFYCSGTCRAAQSFKPMPMRFKAPRCPRCIVCQQDHESNRKSVLDYRIREKFRKSLNTHSESYSRKWDCSRDEAKSRLVSYGWDVETGVEVLASWYDGICAGMCRERFRDIGLAEMHLDIKDSSSLPFFPANVQPLCSNENLQKSSGGIERQALIAECKLWISENS